MDTQTLTQPTADPQTQQKAQAKFREIVHAFENAMLVTHTSEGKHHARPMAVADVSDQGDVWFVSKLDSTKVEELETDDRALVVMQGSSQFLVLSGRAELLHDPKRIEELWSERWRVWFKDKRDPNLVLIHVHPDDAEYWDNSGSEGLKYLAKAALAYVTNKPLGDSETNPDIHGKVTL